MADLTADEAPRTFAADEASVDSALYRARALVCEATTKLREGKPVEALKHLDTAKRIASRQVEALDEIIARIAPTVAAHA